MPAQTVIKLRRDSAADWASVDPILADGELGIETDTKRIKIGDGATEWSGLAYGPAADTMVIKVKNASGSTAIPAGRLVQFAGAAGDTVTVAPAVTDGTIDFHNLVGLTSTEIVADGFGDVIVSGVLKGLNTSSYTVGTLLYADPANAGQLTSTAASAPAFKEPVAAVTRSGAGTSGRLLVRLHIGASLNDIHDVALSSVTTGQVLQFDGAKWVNADLVALPDQTDNEGKYLTTDGTDASWATIDLSSKASLSGATFTGDVGIEQNLVVDGNLTVNGTEFIASASSITIEDNLVQIAHENPANTVDLGLVVGYNDGTAKHSGIVRDVSADSWKLFKGVATEPATTVDFTEGSLDDLQLAGLTATSATIGDVSNTELQYLNGVTSAVQTQLDDKAALSHTHNASAITYTIQSMFSTHQIAAGDKGKVLTAGGATNMVVADALAIGDVITFVQSAAGQITFTPQGGVNLHSVDSMRKTKKQYSTVQLMKTAASTYLLFGDLAP